MCLPNVCQAWQMRLLKGWRTGGGEWNRLFVKQNKMKQGREEEEGEKEKMAKREW